MIDTNPLPKTPQQLLEMEFLKVFRTVAISNKFIVVSDNENSQSFCTTNLVAKGQSVESLLEKYNQEVAEDLVDLIYMNFKHIFKD